MFLNKNYTLFKIAKRIYFRFKDNNIPAFASQLTYSFILSFFPFLIFLLTLISYTPVNSEKLLAFFSATLPQVSYDIVLNTINQTIASRKGTLLPIGMITTIWMSSNGMNAVISGLNKALIKKNPVHFGKSGYFHYCNTFFSSCNSLFSCAFSFWRNYRKKYISNSRVFSSLYRSMECCTVCYYFFIHDFCIFTFIPLYT